jgi:hypothetical protein
MRELSSKAVEETECDPGPSIEEVFRERVDGVEDGGEVSWLHVDVEPMFGKILVKLSVK